MENPNRGEVGKGSVVPLNGSQNSDSPPYASTMNGNQKNGQTSECQGACSRALADMVLPVKTGSGQGGGEGDVEG